MFGVLSEDIEIPESRDENVYKLTTKEMEKAGINALPGSLSEAIWEFRESELMKEIFGEQAFKNFYYAKLEENDLYKTVVSDWERSRYITRL